MKKKQAYILLNISINMQKIQQLFIYFEYFILRKYFKEYFVLEYSKVKLAHVFYTRNSPYDYNSGAS